MFNRAFLGIPDVDPSPQDGYVPAWGAAAGRALWKPITGALLTGFGAGLLAFGSTPGGLTTSAALSWDGSRLLVGNGSPSADLTGILVNRSITTTPNDHGFREESVVNVGAGAGGFCSYDSLPTFNGAATYDHLHSYQGRPLYNGSGSVTDLVAYWSQPGHTGAGTATNAKGLWLKDASGAGTITTQYGIYVDALTRGAANYAIFTNGTALARFGGQIVCAGGSAGVPTILATATIAGDHGVAITNNDSGTGSYAYMSFKGNAANTCIFTAYSSGYTGSAFGITAANYCALQVFGAANAGLMIGTGTAVPVIFGVSGAEVARFRGDGTGLDLATGKVLKVNGTQVVAARDTGWTAMTGSPDKATAYATGTVTLAQLAGRVAQMQASLTTHGLFGA